MQGCQSTTAGGWSTTIETLHTHTYTEVLFEWTLNAETYAAQWGSFVAEELSDWMGPLVAVHADGEWV